MPLPAERLIRYDRLVTPATHRAVLVEPSASVLLDAASRAVGGSWLGRSLADWRTELRRELHLDGRVVATGHQVEFFHAGVLAKVIAAHALAARLGGGCVFFWVDGDEPRRGDLAVPQVTSRGVRRVTVPVPGFNARRPLEDQPAATRAEWLQFFASVTSLHEFGDRSALPAFARAWLTAPGAASGQDDLDPEGACADMPPRSTPRNDARRGAPRLGASLALPAGAPANRRIDMVEAMARAHGATQATLGLGRVQPVRVSRLCATAAFRALAAGLLLDARRGAECYNAAVLAYRRRHRVRARGRPVPLLAIDNNRVEVPLWVVRRGAPRRRLYAEIDGERVRLLADDQVIGEGARSKLADAATHGAPWPIERDGWGLRPRALTLSAFLRLFVAELFIHGIGGAKYDEVTEEFVAAHAGLTPAPIGCVSATLHLPLPHSALGPADIAEARHASRDLRYNPQRHLARVPDDLRREREELVRRSNELRAQRSADRVTRALVFRELRRVNERMLATDPWRAAQYDERVAALESQWALDRIALDREYFFALHPLDSLRTLVDDVQQALCSKS